MFECLGCIVSSIYLPFLAAVTILGAVILPYERNDVGDVNFVLATIMVALSGILTLLAMYLSIGRCYRWCTAQNEDQHLPLYIFITVVVIAFIIAVVDWALSVALYTRIHNPDTEVAGHFERWSLAQLIVTCCLVGPVVLIGFIACVYGCCQCLCDKPQYIVRGRM